MIRTTVCKLLGIQHPIVMGGMGGGHTSVPLVAAVSNAGGLGILGISGFPRERVAEDVSAIRAATEKPFGVNLLSFLTREEHFAAALSARPPVLSLAWAPPEYDLAGAVVRARKAGCVAMYMASSVAEASRAKAAGADVIVAQGTEGGGHVGLMATMALLPMVVDAVAPTPVLAAGGIADGRGLAAALALGAQGILLGTRFLATEESPLHPNFKHAILESDGHDTVLTEIPDLARATVWPGALARARHNAFIARWAGREADLRANQRHAMERGVSAQRTGDADEATLYIGQDAGLIRDLPPARQVVERIVAEAEALLAGKLPALVGS